MTIDVLGGYRPRLPLMSHQLRAIAANDDKPPVPCAEDVFAYLMDMGTGKSATVLADWARGLMNGGVMDLLLFAPAGSYRNWFADKGDEPEDWCELRKHISPALLKRIISVPWISGKATRGELKKRIELMLKQNTDAKRPRILIVNLEAVSSVQKARDLCTEFVSQRGAMIVIDESTAIRSMGSNRTKFLIELGQQSHAKRIMSGLWTPRSPLDLYGQCEFLDPRIIGSSNEWAFKARYAKMVRQERHLPGQYNEDGSVKTRKYMEIVSWRGLDRLRDKVAKYSFRVRAEDCLDLPEKTYLTRDVPLSEEQVRIMNEIKLFGHAEFDGSFMTVDMVIKQILRLMQLNCGYLVEDGTKIVREVPEYRTDALVEVLREHAGKAVVWCPWRPALAKIAARLRKEFGPQSVAEWHGGNKNTRQHDEHRFINDPDCEYMCATQGAGMRGNTWVKPNLVCYYANNYDLEQRDQSERRTWRMGQKNPVTYIDFLAENTIDWKIVKALRKKIDCASMMNQEDVRKWLI